MTTKILNEYKQQLSSMTLFPSDGGRFELEVDGDLVYSKLATGSFPDEGKLLAELRNR